MTEERTRPCHTCGALIILTHSVDHLGPWIVLEPKPGPWRIVKHDASGLPVSAYGRDAKDGYQQHSCRGFIK